MNDLAAGIREKEDGEDAAYLIGLYLPVAAGLNHDTKALLASHDDFLIREAFAVSLARNASEADLVFAEQLVSDSYGQVVRPARIALAAIRRKGHAGRKEQRDSAR